MRANAVAFIVSGAALGAVEGWGFRRCRGSLCVRFLCGTGRIGSAGSCAKLLIDFDQIPCGKNHEHGALIEDSKHNGAGNEKDKASKKGALRVTGVGTEKRVRYILHSSEKEKQAKEDAEASGEQIEKF